MEKVSQPDLTFMQRALTLAQQGLGRTAPNPPVGAVIVKNNVVVGEGFHPAAGMPHAEIYALRQAGAAAVGADVYVTLEPCSHFGRTPPCVKALVEAGVSRIVIGVIDPDPRVSGNGITALRQAGIRVEVGVCENECLQLIAGFTSVIRAGRPYTVYKAAMTLDGHTATGMGDSQWISCEKSRERVHHIRNQVDAVMVGVGTVLRDNPQLTVRLPLVDCRDPLRVVVDTHLRMPPESRMLSPVSSVRTLIATACQDPERIEQLRRKGAEVLILPQTGDQVCLSALWQELGSRHVQCLLLEGGHTLAAAALRAGLIHELMVFVAPRLIGGCPDKGLFSGTGVDRIADGIGLSELTAEPVGADILLTAKVTPCSPV